MSETARVLVIGGGSWATAIVKLLVNNTRPVHWWMRNEDAIEEIRQNGRNPNYLSSVKFKPGDVALFSDLKKSLEGTDIVVLATPSAFIHTIFRAVDATDFEGKKVFSAVKGIIPEYHAIPARYIHKEVGVPYSDIGIICGPCHAEEVAQEKLSYLTVACQDEDNARQMVDLLNCKYLKASTSDDIFGTELSVVLKNIYSIAAGICHGLRYGDNFQAVLMANALQEMERFIDVVSPVHRDVKTSAYLGDLLVTAYSQFSRNRTFGTMIGKGYSVKSAMMEMNMIAEGYYATRSIREINKKFGVEIPIVQAVYNVLYEGIAPKIEIRILSDQLV